RDIMPTVLGAFGLVAKTPDAERFGRSLLRLRTAREAPLHQFVIVRTYRFTSGNSVRSPMMAIVSGHNKLVQSLDEDGLYELYDLASDPGEARDLAWKRPDLRASLSRALTLFQDIDGR